MKGIYWLHDGTLQSSQQVWAEIRDSLPHDIYIYEPGTSQPFGYIDSKNDIWFDLPLWVMPAEMKMQLLLLGVSVCP